MAEDAIRSADGVAVSPNEMRVISPNGVYVEPNIGEIIPGAASRDASGKCIFDVTSYNGLELELDGDNCVVKVLKKNKPQRSLLRNSRAIDKPQNLVPMDSAPWVAPEPGELFGAPLDPKQKRGTSQNIDPALIRVPEPQSKDEINPRSYSVTCPRIQVKLRGWMAVSRYVGQDIFNRPQYYSIAKIYPRARFYRSLNNGGLGSIRPYKYPSDWSAWAVFNSYLTHFTFRGFRGLGPLADGPSLIKIHAIGYFASNVGARENLEITGSVHTYRDMIVYHDCSAHGALVGKNRLRCRGYGRYVKPAEC